MDLRFRVCVRNNPKGFRLFTVLQVTKLLGFKIEGKDLGSFATSKKLNGI
jgi:hypothetical protein